MLRENNGCGIIREYKNHNITIKYDTDTIQDAEKDPVLTIVSALFEIDCDFIGDTYCLSNYETGHTVYNWYSDKVYVFPWRFLDELAAGKTIRLYAREPEDYDREYLAIEYGYNDPDNAPETCEPEKVA